VQSSPKVIVNTIDDGVSGLLSIIKNHAIGNIIIVSIAIIIPPPKNNLNDRDKLRPLSSSNKLRKFQMH